MKWLLTAFEPFGQAASNSSLIVLNALQKRGLPNSVGFLPSVPVSFKNAWPTIEGVLEKNPSIQGVLCLGQSAQRPQIAVEHVALNWKNSKSPDNNGVSPNREMLSKDGPDMYWSSIPWEKITTLKSMTDSYSAGVYVCNAVFYHTMAWARAHNKYGGFVHIPVLESQTDQVLANALRMPDDLAINSMESIVRELTQL